MYLGTFTFLWLLSTLTSTTPSNLGRITLLSLLGLEPGFVSDVPLADAIRKYTIVAESGL